MAINDELALSPLESLLEEVSRKITSDFGLGNKGLEPSRVDIAFRHHFKNRGQQTRPVLAFEASQALRLDAHTGVCFGACIEALHNASLVQDDLQDGALERRGQPSVHSLFGKDVALGLATRLVTTAFVSLSSAGIGPQGESAVQRVHAATCQTINGQSSDLDPNADCSIAGLLEMARQKSGPLFALALELPLIGAGYLNVLDQAHEAACCLGLGYQIFDDLKDRTADRLQVSDKNIVNALSRQNESGEAICRAVEIAEAELMRAGQLADELPVASGGRLRKMADELLTRLRAYCG